jgi:flagellar brake protein
VNAPIPPDSRKGPPSLSDAVEPIAGNATVVEMVDPNEIGDALTLLAQYGDAVTIYPPEGAQAVMARILSVDPDLPHFVIELNEGSTLPPGECTFVAWLRNARFQFRLNDPHWNALPDQPTLIPAEFPEICHLMNRRAFTRLEMPVGVYFTASFASGGEQYELQLYDVSVGGVGMRCTPREANGLSVGRTLQRVRLDLGEGTEITCDLEIRISRRFRTFLLGEQVQLGCQFKNLSQAAQDELQRIIERLNNGRR